MVFFRGGGEGVTNDPARFSPSPRRWSLERTHSRKQTCSLSLLPTAPEHLRLTSFSALFPGNITSQMPGSWVCWSMASGSSCDPQSGSSRLFHYSRSPGGPVTNTVHCQGHIETRLAGFLLSLGNHIQLDKDLRVSVPRTETRPTTSLPVGC